MTFWLNESPRDQIFMIPGYRAVVPPRYGVTDRAARQFDDHPAGTVDMTRFRDFKTACRHRSDGRAVLHRSSALGDILMMMALAQTQQDCCCSFDRNRFAELNAVYHPDLRGRTGLILDGEVEQDHRDSPAAPPHRVDMMAAAAGFQIKTVDWTLPFDVPKRDVPRFDVLVQAGGSTPVKRLNPGVLQPALLRLVDSGLSVGLVGSDASGSWSHRLDDLRGRTDLWDLWNLVARAAVVITQDSGVLWISHFTRTPVVLLCGPTHAESRLCRHPAATAWVDLAALVGCRPCGETQARCRDIDCMGLRIPIQQFSNQLIEAVDRLRYKL